MAECRMRHASRHGTRDMAAIDLFNSGPKVRRPRSARKWSPITANHLAVIIG